MIDKEHPYRLESGDLDTLIAALRQAGHQVFAPVPGDSAIVYDEISSASQLPWGWGDRQDKGYYRLVKRDDNACFGYAVGPQSWKQFLNPPRRKVWDATNRDGVMAFQPTEEPRQKRAFIGVRSCELAAIAIQDKVFTQGQFPNETYRQRREDLFTVAVNCTAPSATCFCTSMGTGPMVNSPSDLVMTEVIGDGEHYFVLSAHTDGGLQILSNLPVVPAEDHHCVAANAAVSHAAAQIEANRSFDSNNLKDLIYRQVNSPLWDTLSDRCLSCANCTLACPTCFCSSVEDTTDLSGEHAERWERWDSCFTGDFSYVHGGKVRESTASRYRQWMTHKLASWHDQFDSSGCVGCGRCISWCPVGIDITENIQQLREADPL